MLTPLDKATSGANDILQIVVTTACDLYTCSNCTQLLPFRRDYRHMRLDCFETAVKSLKNWPGVVALFGGNPCSHPQFPQLCEILEAHITPQRRRGLWSNNLRGHGALVRRVFFPHGRFNLTVHRVMPAAEEMCRHLPGRVVTASIREPAVHAPILLHAQDFGIAEPDWARLREACPINQHWSGAIVERDGKPYGYFCEVAAALDGIRGENHGLPVEVGQRWRGRWWESPIGAYKEQIKRCCDRGCGVPLRGQGHEDQAKTYDVSPSFLPLVQETTLVQIQTHATPPTGCPDPTDYLRQRTTS